MADTSNGHTDVDDWESIEDEAAIDRQLNKLKEMRAEEPGLDSNKSDILEFGKVKILQNDSGNAQRTHYQPQIKILQRKPQENDNATGGMGERKASVKSLEQREAEYAEARKRILGSNQNTDDESLDSATNSPKIAHKTQKASEKVVSREPFSPSANGKGGFQKRSLNCDS